MHKKFMELHYKNSAGYTEAEIKKTAAALAEYRQYLVQILGHDTYDAPETSVNLPIDRQALPIIKVLKKSKAARALKYIFVIGIGGSSLGTKAIYDAIFGFSDILDTNRAPKIIFLETTDPEFLRRLQNFIDLEIKNPEEILINIISKSGTTTETVANAEVVIAALTKKFDAKKIEERIVVTTDENSKLWQWAASPGPAPTGEAPLRRGKKISALAIPSMIGGRFSVFSAVGLFPLSFTPIDIESLCEGAATMRKMCIENELENNPAMISATLLFLNAKAGKTINDNFFFAPQLESLGKWYRQLMGESIGKEKDLDDNIVHAGITPTVSIGSTDLHSVGQLYLGGPTDKFTTFIWARNQEDAIALSNNSSAQKIMQAILEGTKTAYSKKDLHFMEIVMPEISAFALGEFLQFKMIEMMYLGKLMNVNTFDQPNVELYKKETRKILGRK